MSKLRSIVGLCIGLFWVSSGYCQNLASAQTVQHTLAVHIPEVSLVNVVGSTNLHLQFLKPVEAGQPIGGTTSDSSFWLTYSFIKGGISRPKSHIYAKITNGDLPTGTFLSVTAKPHQGIGNGGFGVPTGTVNLSRNESRVIENISSSFTGSGMGNGHQLIYQLSLMPHHYHMLDFESSQDVTILYTIAD